MVSKQDIRRDPIGAFIDWLYDECPVGPDEVPRKKLRALWRGKVLVAKDDSVELASMTIVTDDSLPENVIAFRNQ
jgi:hypothetical protein